MKPVPLAGAAVDSQPLPCFIRRIAARASGGVTCARIASMVSTMLQIRSAARSSSE